MSLWDPGYESDDNRLRGLSYAQTDVFLLCYDVSQKLSLERVKSYWVSDLRNFQPSTPIILVALKTDLRKETAGCVSCEEGRAMAEDVSAVLYREVSSLENDGIIGLFSDAKEAVVQFNPDRE